MMNFHYARKRLEIERQVSEFERGMNSLTAVIGGQPDCVTEAFKQWVRTTPFPWQVGVDYCIERAKRGLSLPFTVNG
jgi:hypothetical protein